VLNEAQLFMRRCGRVTRTEVETAGEPQRGLELLVLAAARSEFSLAVPWRNRQWMIERDAKLREPSERNFFMVLDSH
jgi:hypothetical protein